MEHCACLQWCTRSEQLHSTAQSWFSNTRRIGALHVKACVVLWRAEYNELDCCTALNCTECNWRRARATLFATVVSQVQSLPLEGREWQFHTCTAHSSHSKWSNTSAHCALSCEVVWALSLQHCAPASVAAWRRMCTRGRRVAFIVLRGREHFAPARDRPFPGTAKRPAGCRRREGGGGGAGRLAA